MEVRHKYLKSIQLHILPVRKPNKFFRDELIFIVSDYYICKKPKFKAVYDCYLPIAMSCSWALQESPELEINVIT